MSKLSHVDNSGKATMVDVSAKETTSRVALAQGKIFVGKEAFEQIRENKIKKGDVLSIAQISGIMGAKKTSELIPLCHNLFLSKVDVSCELDEKENSVLVNATAKTEGKTGVEMEALTAVSVACLTIYDMCKAVNKEMVISEIKLLEKSGGKSGHFKFGGKK